MGDLILYQFELSFHSQLVRTGLAEKHLSYKKKSIQIAQLEQLDPWYMKINPKGQVPTLVRGETVVTESEDILKYLDETFPETAKICPDSTSEEGERWSYYKELGSKFDPEQTLIHVPWYHDVAGSKHPDMKKKKIIAEKVWKAKREELPIKCDKLAKDYPDLADAYVKRREQVADLPEEPDVEKLKLFMAVMEDVLTKIDHQLRPKEDDAEEAKSKENEKWLCGDNYTIADIYWTTALHWLEDAGLADRFWGEGKRAHLAAYYDRSKRRESFRKGMPSATTLMFQGIKNRWCTLL
ncbi:ganglioside-induced differentiation-associated protein 1-like [Ptychodera flava]|uniref:ganglioside-induced differentiation-associated protein 1-like n=1 Tax=Ptychodera flava TaxID=63121 RepID=UPI003969F59C